MGAKGQPKTGGRKPGVPNYATRELREIAQRYTEQAIDTLVSIMGHGEAESARIMAARELLDRGYGKAPQAVIGDPNMPMHLIVMTGVPRLLEHDDPDD